MKYHMTCMYCGNTWSGNRAGVCMICSDTNIKGVPMENTDVFGYRFSPSFPEPTAQPIEIIEVKKEVEENANKDAEAFELRAIDALGYLYGF